MTSGLAKLTPETFLLGDLAECTSQSLCEGWLGDETDTGSLERAEGNVGKELSNGRGTQVDGGPVLLSSLVAEVVDGLLLPEFVTTELESTLDKVSGKGGSETSQESASALVGDDLAEATNEALGRRGAEIETRFVSQAATETSLCEPLRWPSLTAESCFAIKTIARRSKATCGRLLSLTSVAPSRRSQHLGRCPADYLSTQPSPFRATALTLLYTSGWSWILVLTTSRGVAAPWVTAQPTAPASANLV